MKIQTMALQAALALALVQGSPAAFAVTYSNYSAVPDIGFGVNGSNDINMDGEIFTAQTNGTLNDLTFYQNGSANGFLEFVISTWNPGPGPSANLVTNDSTPIFAQTVAINAATNGPSAITVSNINLSFSAGQSFLGYFTDQSPTGTGTLPNYVWPMLDGVFNAGNGAFAQAQVQRYASSAVANPFSATDPTIRTMLWNAGPTLAGGNLMFTANFTPTAAVPEPGTYAMMFAGLLVITGVARRRASA